MSILDRIVSSLLPSPEDACSPTEPVPSGKLATVRANLVKLRGELADTQRVQRSASDTATAARTDAALAARVEADAQARVAALVEDDASDDAVDAAQRTAERARLRRAPLERRLSEATSRHAEAVARVATVEADVAKVEATIALAGTEERASLETFRAKTAPHFEALVEAIKAVREHATAIDAAFAETNAAAAECRAAGIEVAELDRLHVVLPLLTELDIIPTDDGLRWARNEVTPCSGLAGLPHRGGLVRVLCFGVETLEKIQRTPLEHVAARREELALVASSRTSSEARQLVEVRQAEAARIDRKANDPAEIAAREAWRLEQERMADAPRYDQFAARDWPWGQ